MFAVNIHHLSPAYTAVIEFVSPNRLNRQWEKDGFRLQFTDGRDAYGRLHDKCSQFIKGTIKGKWHLRATKNLEATEASRFFLVRGTGLEPAKRCFRLSLPMPTGTIMWGSHAILLPSHVR